MKPASFASRLLDWFDQHGRHDLPWQHDPSAYRVWISEIMLQQTQVATVIPYYERFMSSFSDVAILAAATQDEVLNHWSGLGYYARARNLHKSAQIVHTEFQDQFPDTQEALEALPGIGRSTAGAIQALAQNQRAVILDGNVKRVLCRHGAVPGWTGTAAVQKVLWGHAEQYTPDKRVKDYTQAIMDLGATLCTRTKPRCPECPLQTTCVANKQQNQTAYPEKKPRKKKPKREQTILILINEQQQFWLERRPEKGIWGGLWSFPELREDHSADQWLSDAGFKSHDKTELKPVIHQFTHFELTLKPLLIQVSATSVRESNSADTQWVVPEKALPGGVPAPIAKLIKQLPELS